TAQWYPRLMRKDFTVGLNVSETAVDDPDQQFYENYVCGSERNYTGYCSPEVDKLVDQQSAEADGEKRKRIVWEIEKRLAEDGARPVIFYPRQATCRQAQVKGMPLMGRSPKRPGAHSRFRSSTTRRACHCTRRRRGQRCGR